MAGLFCVHKRLTTGCPECKPQALPKETLAGEARFVTEEEREKAQRRRVALYEGRPLDEDEPKERRAPAATPAAAAALARRQKAARKISPAEADRATAWWVKK